MNRYRYIVIGFVFGVLFTIVMGLIFLKPYLHPATEIKAEVQLINLTPEQQLLYKSKFVAVRAGEFEGSGCKTKSGNYLTALHTLIPAILDGKSIYVNSQEAWVIDKSMVKEDYAILSTKSKKVRNSKEIPAYEFQIGEDFIVVGSPGNQTALVQPGKIINVKVYDENGVPKPGSKKVYTMYVNLGLSGGCIYPVGSDTPVGIFIKSGGDSHIGEISLISKEMDEESEPHE